jgi:hypothetical protein
MSLARLVELACIILLSFSHGFAKQEYTIHFDAGTKIAITQSILNGFA